MRIAEKIGKAGRITHGEQAGFLVRIEDDAKNTGGFLILCWKKSSSEGFDNWVENLSDLEQFFVESGWDVEWKE